MRRARARRRLLVAGVAAPLAVWLARVGDALAAGRIEKGVYRVRGSARVNTVAAREGMDVNAGDVVTTGADGELVFVADRDAFLVRTNSKMEVAGGAAARIETGLRIVTGAVLSVFAPGRPRRIVTPTATIGIRGTGIYVDAMPDKTYVCTCYGVADIQAVDDPAARETVRTRHHDQPRYVMAHGAPQMIMGAPVVNHTDAELIFLENLVGRAPPFVAEGAPPYD